MANFPPPKDDEGFYDVLEGRERLLFLYVSSTLGDDINDGLSAETPIQTIDRAWEMLQPGGTILLRRGDAWEEMTAAYKVSDTVITAYGTGNRPIVREISPWTQVSNVIIDSLEFSGRMRVLSIHENIAIQNCYFNKAEVTVDPEGGRLANFVLYRSIIQGTEVDPDKGGHCQGIFIGETDGIRIDQCYFDKNGYPRTKFNHNIYVSGSCTGLTVTGCVITRGSASGLQARPGGTITANYFAGNANQLNFGFMEGEGPMPDPVTGKVEGNVFLDSDPLNGSEWAIKCQNIAEARVSKNLSIDSGAFQIGAPEDKPVASLTFRNNVIADQHSEPFQFYGTYTSDVIIKRHLLITDAPSVKDRDGAAFVWEKNVTVPYRILEIETIPYDIWEGQDKGSWDYTKVGSWITKKILERAAGELYVLKHGAD